MAACGLPLEDREHAENIANFALMVQACVSHHIKSPLLDGTNPLALRVGIHTGSCIAGVIGTSVPHYNIAGDLTHATTRYERLGLGGKIHCSSDMFGRLQHMSAYGQKDAFYEFEPRGIIQGQQGESCFTYWLEGATDVNAHANSTVVNDLLKKVGDMLGKREWEKRHGSFQSQRSNGGSNGVVFRGGGEISSIVTLETVGSTECGTNELFEHSFKSSFEEIYPTTEDDSDTEDSPTRELTGSFRYFL